MIVTEATAQFNFEFSTTLVFNSSTQNCDVAKAETTLKKNYCYGDFVRFKTFFFLLQNRSTYTYCKKIPKRNANSRLLLNNANKP